MEATKETSANVGSAAETTVKLRVRRFDPAHDPAPVMREYEVPYTRGQSVLSLLGYIAEHVDPTLAFPLCLCRIGACNQCAMKVNGKSMLTCNRIVNPGETITVEPSSERQFIRDVV